MSAAYNVFTVTPWHERHPSPVKARLNGREVLAHYGLDSQDVPVITCVVGPDGQEFEFSPAELIFLGGDPPAIARRP